LSDLKSDQFMFRRGGSGKALIASEPLIDDHRKFTEAPKTHQAAVREATTYANFAMMQESYSKEAIAAGTTAYNLALTDWFGAPRVLEINVDRWTGEIGQTILVKARDNVKVARLSVVIRDSEENVLERGEAVQSEAGSAWWNYTTKSLVKMTPFPIVEATAQDLAGNSDSFVIS
jgi:hypothetical protein